MFPPSVRHFLEPRDFSSLQENKGSMEAGKDVNMGKMCHFHLTAHVQMPIQEQASHRLSGLLKLL